MTEPAKHCLHCEIGRLCQTEFHDQSDEQTIHDLLEVVADYIDGANEGRQAELMTYMMQVIARNCGELITGTYKRGRAYMRVN